MPYYRTVWTEGDLYKEGWTSYRTFTCDTCGEEVTVYENRKHNRKLFLMSNMEVHPNHQQEGSLSDA